jgi:hypothetical protein
MKYHTILVRVKGRATLEMSEKVMYHLGDHVSAEIHFILFLSSDNRAWE